MRADARTRPDLTYRLSTAGNRTRWVKRRFFDVESKRFDTPWTLMAEAMHRPAFGPDYLVTPIIRWRNPDGSEDTRPLDPLRLGREIMDSVANMAPGDFPITAAAVDQFVDAKKRMMHERWFDQVSCEERLRAGELLRKTRPHLWRHKQMLGEYNCDPRAKYREIMDARSARIQDPGSCRAQGRCARAAPPPVDDTWEGSVNFGNYAPSEIEQQQQQQRDHSGYALTDPPAMGALAPGMADPCTVDNSTGVAKRICTVQPTIPPLVSCGGPGTGQPLAPCFDLCCVFRAILVFLEWMLGKCAHFCIRLRALTRAN